MNPLLAEAREALERNDYGDAISGIDKFLAGNPGNHEGLTIKKQALYQQGKTLSRRAAVGGIVPDVDATRAPGAELPGHGGAG